MRLSGKSVRSKNIMGLYGRAESSSDSRFVSFLGNVIRYKTECSFGVTSTWIDVFKVTEKYPGDA